MAVNSYYPNHQLVRLMTNLLEYATNIEYGQEVEKNRKRYLDKEKVTILNEFVFPSMTNLAFFFRSISRYPELKKIFDDDVKDLLGINRENPKRDKYGFIFSDLVRAILLIEEEKNDEEDEEMTDMDDFSSYTQLARKDKSDFRLRLNHILLEIIRIKVLAIDLAGVSKIEKRFLLDDFNRVMLCTRIIAEGGTQITEDTDNEEIENNKPPHRTIRRIPLRENEDPV
jgi:hypothetical protein